MELLNKLKINESNPRTIGEKEFNKLKNSIKGFLDMLAVREIAYDDDFVIWGGNQRFKAYKMLVEAGAVEYQEKYFRKLPSNWTLQEKREFAILDNSPQGISGAFDSDILSLEWKDLPLEEWGIVLPEWKEENFDDKNKEIDTDELGRDLDTECPRCHFKFKKETDV